MKAPYRGTFFVLLLLGVVPFAVAAPDYKVEIVDYGGILFGVFFPAPMSTSGERLLDETLNTEIRVKVTNVGDATCYDCKVEAGIYQRSLVNNWYAPTKVLASGLNVADVDNCVQSEPNVDTAQVKLDAGQSTLVKFRVSLPAVDAQSTAYGFHVSAFRKCWNEAVKDGTYDIGQTSYDVERVTIVDELIGPEPKPETCSDGQINQDEPDKDCGGDNCVPCGIYNACKTNRDCQTGLQCSFSTQHASYRCLTSPNPPSPPQDAFCGNNKVEPGEDCNTCPQDMAACAKPFPEAEGKGADWLVILGAIGAVLAVITFVRGRK